MAFEDIRNKAASVVASLTPDTTRGGAARFIEHQSNGTIFDLPGNKGSDRKFEVYGTPGPVDESMMAEPNEHEYIGTLTIAVVYAADVAKIRDTRSRIDEDHDLLSYHLTKSTNYFSDANTETHAIFTAGEGPDVDEVEGVDRKLIFATYPFAVVYRTKRTT